MYEILLILQFVKLNFFLKLMCSQFNFPFYFYFYFNLTEHFKKDLNTKNAQNKVLLTKAGNLPPTYTCTWTYTQGLPV